jgi:hypothetical protein
VILPAALLVLSAASQPLPTSPAMQAAPADDPARLAEARIVAAKLLPPGVYREVMNIAMGPVMDGFGDSMKALPLRQMAEMGGIDPKDAAALDKIKLDEVMAIYDPHWQDRSRLTMRAMFDAMGAFFTTQEPTLREAYARAYANRFTLEELRALTGFFATPVGTKYARQYMTIATDPAIGAEMKAMMPKMMAQMPTFVGAAQKATASLPPVRKLESLSDDEKARLAKALGVTVEKLQDPKSKI